MLFDVDGLMVSFDDEKLLKSLIDTCGSQIKRAFLKAHGSYSDDDLKSTQYVEGLWAGLVATQTSTGGSQAIADAKRRRVQKIEGNYNSKV